jgi:hypothetical protein
MCLCFNCVIVVQFYLLLQQYQWVEKKAAWLMMSKQALYILYYIMGENASLIMLASGTGIQGSYTYAAQQYYTGLFYMPGGIISSEAQVCA